MQARKFTWFRQVEQKPTVVTDAQCTQQKTCSAVAPTPICPLVKECPDGTVVNLQAPPPPPPFPAPPPLPFP